MGYTVEQFSAECCRILKADPGPEGRQKVCALVREVCKDEAFVAANLGDDVPNRKVLYEDPELGFCILGHVHRDAPGRLSPPHDHGPSWAIYGQAKGELHQRLTAARQQGNCLRLELIRKMTPFLTHSISSRSPRSLPKMPADSGDAYYRLCEFPGG